MNFAIENSFISGDPVQVVQNSNILGKVIRVIEYNWQGALISLVCVKLIGRYLEVAYYPKELRICKCATRIPKGVSQCQKETT